MTSIDRRHETRSIASSPTSNTSLTMRSTTSSSSPPFGACSTLRTESIRLTSKRFRGTTMPRGTTTQPLKSTTTASAVRSSRREQRFPSQRSPRQQIKRAEGYALASFPRVAPGTPLQAMDLPVDYSFPENSLRSNIDDREQFSERAGEPPRFRCNSAAIGGFSQPALLSIRHLRTLSIPAREWDERDPSGQRARPPR